MAPTSVIAAGNEQTYPTNLKLLLIGNSSVGKSSLLLRFTDDDFLSEEETTATIGVDFKVKQLQIDDRRFKLSIWDTAGQERFRTLTSSYYRGAQGVVLVYDVSNRQSFQSLASWFKEISTYCSPEVVKIIVGNKVDKEMFSRQVTKKEAEEYAEKMGCLFVECSAKTKVNVEEAFRELVLRIIDTPSLWSKNPRHAPVRDPATLRGDGTVALDDQDMPGGWSSYASGCNC